jgi:threonine synthase
MTHPGVGWRCVVCGTTVDIAELFPWRCPRSTPTDRRHVLRLDDHRPPAAPLDDPDPFVRYGPRLAWWASATANGLTEHDCIALTRSLVPDAAVTPFGRSDLLSDELGFDVWVKDETGNVAGSHKFRHLTTILLQLLAAERRGRLTGRPPLAIASCGNAALAAATLAARVDWPIDVYVPEWMDDDFGHRLDELHARTHRCPRQPDDPPGDPAIHRFRSAVAAGAIPFSVQGPENALCLDGGRTLGWEMADAASDAGVGLDAVFVQVGGGAFATCVADALGGGVRLHPVQTEGCAPLARAWEQAADLDLDGIAGRWDELMVPWPDPQSAADGILDDETYDGLGVIAAMRRSGGTPVVASEEQVLAARDLAHRAGFGASHTGAAGLAGLLAARDRVPGGATVAIVMSGVAR